MGKLYVVATPIGNMADFSQRAIEVLGGVSVIAAEDTRSSRALLQRYSIDTPLVAYHEHNEGFAAAGLVTRMLSGDSVALVSDAGTPLISDPGYQLISAAHEAGIEVVPIPGPSAVLAALSVCGLATDRFVFEGFLPSRAGQRTARLQVLQGEPRTLVFFEAPHRVEATVLAMGEVFGPERQVTVCREMSKHYEQVRKTSLASLAANLATGDVPQRGEFVLVVAGAKRVADQAEGERVMRCLLGEVSLSRAAQLTHEITGAGRKDMYQFGLTLQRSG